MKTLQLNENNLLVSDLPDDIFTNLKNLEHLEMQKNSLTSINPKWFASLKTLSTLDLSHNSLDELTENCFTALNNLKILYLDYNEISQLASESFGDHPELRILTIDYNSLNEIDRKFFENFASLEYFSSRRNKCFDGFVIGGEQPIDFENEEIYSLLKKCYSSSENGYPLYYIWIGLGVAVLVCAFFVTINFLYERSMKKKIDISNL